MKLIAHRGFYNKEIQENTLLSFKNAYKCDEFVGFEFDIRETKDKKFVVCHDATIDRVSNGFGLIEKYTLKELQKFNFGTKKNPCKITTLEEVLNTFPNKIKLIEIKKIQSYKKFVNILNKYNNIWVCSFSNKTMNEVCKYKRNFKIGILNNIINSSSTYNQYDFVALYYRIATEALINYFNGRNINVLLFGIGNILNKKNISDFFIKKCYLVINKEYY